MHLQFSIRLQCTTRRANQCSSQTLGPLDRFSWRFCRGPMLVQAMFTNSGADAGVEGENSGNRQAANVRVTHGANTVSSARLSAESFIICSQSLLSKCWWHAWLGVVMPDVDVSFVSSFCLIGFSATHPGHQACESSAAPTSNRAAPPQCLREDHNQIGGANNRHRHQQRLHALSHGRGQ